jgi:hypothetical protein
MSMRYSYWAAVYYRQQRERGKKHHVAVRALAFKWLRILYRCWKDHEPYDEAKYLFALRQRKAPLLKRGNRGQTTVARYGEANAPIQFPRGREKRGRTTKSHAIRAGYPDSYAPSWSPSPGSPSPSSAEMSRRPCKTRQMSICPASST